MTLDAAAAELSARGPEIEAARAVERQAAAVVTAQRGEYLPDVILSAQLAAYDSDFFPEFLKRNSVAITVSWPIWDAGRREVAFARAREQRDVARAQREERERATTEQIAQAYNVRYVPFASVYATLADVVVIADPAIVCGFARFHGMPVAAIGHQKGRDTKQRQVRNFGMPKPEGYRKALRAMKLAEKFDRPIFCFIDTPGAYPGIDAEERGQAEAIAYNLREMAKLTVPVIVTVIGEGGSGGALAIGVGDQVLMLENAIYSVISPEGCAAILWKDSSQADRAAEGLKLTAPDLKNAGLVDEVVAEPDEGAHKSHDETAKLLDAVLCSKLAESASTTPQERLARRYAKLRQMGKWGTA